MELGKIGSGLDVASIVKALVDADVAPKNNSLDRREKGLNAELSGLSTLKSALSILDSSLADLKDGSAFESLAIKAPASADIVQTGSPTEGNYSLSISALATSQVLASAGFASATTAVGTGTLTLLIGDPTYSSGSSGAYSGFVADATKTVSITIDSSNNTVSGIRDAINASTAGITASLVVDGDLTRLLFTCDETGKDKAMSIVSDDDDGDDSNNSGLSQLSYNISSGSFFGNLSEPRASQDANFSLNGLNLTNASNKISGLVEGLDFTLRSVTTGVDAVVVQRDSAAIEAKVQKFTDAYNAYQSTLSSLMDYTDTAGVLSGDSTARRIQSAIRSAATGAISIAGNTFSSLADVGITSDRFGALALSSTKFQAALASSSDDMKAFFSGSTLTQNLSDNTDARGLADNLATVINTYINSSTGMLGSRETQIEGSIRNIADDRADVITRMTKLEERYTRQFTAMDTLVSQLQGTSDFLSNQMDALKAAANR
ncbi:flagellar filament capping protein FliD [Luminiphilus sp.]|nr:flagellar filament capping protein FliD [Luminiphilus sp.]